MLRGIHQKLHSAKTLSLPENLLGWVYCCKNPFYIHCCEKHLHMLPQKYYVLHFIWTKKTYISTWLFLRCTAVHSHSHRCVRKKTYITFASCSPVLFTRTAVHSFPLCKINKGQHIKTFTKTYALLCFLYLALLCKSLGFSLLRASLPVNKKHAYFICAPLNYLYAPLCKTIVLQKSQHILFASPTHLFFISLLQQKWRSAFFLLGS